MEWGDDLQDLAELCRAATRELVYTERGGPATREFFRAAYEMGVVGPDHRELADAAGLLNVYAVMSMAQADDEMEAA